MLVLRFADLAADAEPVANVGDLSKGHTRLGHTKLLLRLGLLYQKAGKDEQARTTLLRAYHTAPTDANIVGAVLHELLHLDGDDTVEELLPAVRQIEDLLPAFWIA